MVLPVIIRHDVAANRVFRTPTVACVAVFAVMQPHRLSINHLNVVYRADSGASSAASAVLVGSEAFASSEEGWIALSSLEKTPRFLTGSKTCSSTTGTKESATSEPPFD